MTLSAAEAEAALTATGCGRAWFDRVWLDDKSYLIGIRRCIYVMESIKNPEVFCLGSVGVHGVGNNARYRLGQKNSDSGRIRQSSRDNQPWQFLVLVPLSDFTLEQLDAAEKALQVDLSFTAYSKRSKAVFRCPCRGTVAIRAVLAAQRIARDLG